jgi:regulator of sirC expression with transglutaminase-like and TPR domain
MSFDPNAYLETLSSVAEDAIDLAEAALALAARERPGVVMERYINHVKKICDDTAARYEELVEAGADEDAGTQLAALKHAIVTLHGYKGDVNTYNDLQNASLMRVIDRRAGMPVTLAILYIVSGQAQGWDVAGLDFPGHFLCRLQKDGRRVIFDPFYDCKILEAPDLRSFVKQVRGVSAELSADFFVPTSNRDILMRLQNNIKYRQIEGEDYEGALKTVEGMRFIDRNEYRLLLDAGVLYARTGRTKAAIETLEDYIKKAPKDRDRHDAGILLQELKNTLQ